MNEHEQTNKKKTSQLKMLNSCKRNVCIEIFKLKVGKSTVTINRETENRYGVENQITEKN